ncbi:hypothetical protein [Schinkia azotoformans]|uniref:hypothetical protein n=1 Tax=Schinkia azotoformans TaxID=1454 RepID=UPI002DBD432D|nr:hypothetical protein [Schinkia azotoformans]MEC1716578.1 hypothetical protein [Schinkia azotoformans]MEC1739416.1 hypothetical protein [Schinkia azotoformans]MEC1745514.1 hypothetical protein [Schinkia azotoformans]MEC1756577.1 hypothetical protein [Schinkia azotoformans]MEC1765844.1 hypothetical protein [Schinkia azotoformans]
MGTVWRPALRCDSAFRDYIDSLNEVTSLDRNQIMRAMMFVAAHSEDFKFVISEYKKDGVTTLPDPTWQPWEDEYWLNQIYQKKTDVIDQTPDINVVSIKKEGGVTKIDVSSLF